MDSFMHDQEQSQQFIPILIRDSLITLSIEILKIKYDIASMPCNELLYELSSILNRLQEAYDHDFGSYENS